MTAPVPLLVGEAPVTGVPAPAPPVNLDTGPLLVPSIALGAGRDDTDPVFTTVGGDHTPRASFTASRGRDSVETEDMSTGVVTITLDNSDGALTPGRNPDIDSDTPIKVEVVPPAPYDSLQPVFRGFIDDISSDPAGGIDEVALVTFTGLDGTDALKGVERRSDFATELLALEPWAFWPLSEPDGAITVGDISGNGRSPLPLKQYLWPGDPLPAFKFGEDAMAPSDAATSLSLTATLTGSSFITTTSGYYLEVPTGRRGVNLAYGQGFTIVMAFETALHINGAMSLFQATDQNHDDLIDVYLEGGDQKLQAFIWPDAINDGQFDTSAASYGDGKSHLLVAVVQGNAKTLHIYVDGILVATATTAVAGTNTVVNGRLTFGVGTADNAGGFPFSGRMSDIAIFPGQRFTQATVSRLYDAWNGFPGETADQRISRNLVYANWQGGAVLDAGRTKLGPVQAGGKSILEACTDAAKADQGQFFIGANGSARFHSRRHRLNTPSRVTFGADDTMPFVPEGLVPATNKSLLKNDYTGTRPGGATLRVSDEASVIKHGRQTDTVDLAVLSDDELLDALNWKLAEHAWSKVLITGFTIDPYNFPALWQWAFGLEIGDRVTLANLGQRAPADELDVFIEKITHTGSETSYLVTYAVSAAGAEMYWQLGVPGFSELDLTTRLAY